MKQRKCIFPVRQVAIEGVSIVFLPSSSSPSQLIVVLRYLFYFFWDTFLQCFEIPFLQSGTTNSAVLTSHRADLESPKAVQLPRDAALSFLSSTPAEKFKGDFRRERESESVKLSNWMMLAQVLSLHGGIPHEWTGTSVPLFHIIHSSRGRY